MTNQEKSELAKYVKAGKTFNEIRKLVDCSDQTIRNYIKAFAVTINNEKSQ